MTRSVANDLTLARNNDRIAMATAVTHHIRVNVKVHFEAAQSDPKVGRFLFNYRITITNNGQRPVQLMRRHWYINDSLSPQREVEGPGVVGETPELGPGDAFSYNSFCDLRSGFGRMQGTYLMRNLDDDSTFDVRIPSFELQWPWTAN
ncbi:MAG TPA: Co2+/Mg2+ efflux protein ApaG [Flavobacteriales bacterium]